jgi:hypothetical protein
MQDEHEHIAFLILFAAACISVAIAMQQIKCLHDSAPWRDWLCW